MLLFTVWVSNKGTGIIIYSKVFHHTSYIAFISPLPVSPLLPLSAAGEDADDEEDRSCKCSQEDDDDGHGVSRGRHRCRGREMRSLTRGLCLWSQH